MAADDRKFTIPFGGKIPPVREFIAIATWVLVVTKLFIFDFDVYAVERFAPRLRTALGYKVFIEIGLLALALLLMGRKKLMKNAVYVLLYPLVLLAWRIPVFTLKRWPLALAFAPVIYRAISTFPSTFLCYTLAALSGLAILASLERLLLVGAMLGLYAFLAIHLNRSFRNAYNVGMMEGVTSVLKKIRESAESGSFDQPPPPPGAAKVAQPPQAAPNDPSTLYILRTLTEIVIAKVSRISRGRQYDLYLIGCWLYTVSMTSVVYALEFLSLRKIDPSAFGPGVAPSFFGFLGFSLGHLMPARISVIAPVTRFAVLISYSEGACALVILVILVFTVLTAARESFRTGLDDFSLELRALAGALDQRITNVYRMTIAEVELLLLRDRAPIVNALRKARGLPEILVQPDPPQNIPPSAITLTREAQHPAA
jgi:hypothetical protein